MTYAPSPEIRLRIQQRYSEDQPREANGQFGSTGGGDSGGGSGGSGGGGQGGGVRQSLAKAGTAEEISHAAAAEARAITGRDIRFNMTGDPQLAREHSEGVLRGLEKYPGTPLQEVRVGQVDAAGHEEAWAATSSDGSRITFASQGDPAAYRESLARFSNRQPRELTVATPMGTALHEFGHAAANSYNVNGQAATVARTYADNVLKDDYRAAVGYSISTRAMSNSHEMVAEAFADVLGNGGKASDFSMIVVGAMDKAIAAKS